MNLDFGKKLKELREAAGESQAALAEVLGMNMRQIQRYEGGSIPKTDVLTLLSKHYNYDFFSFFNGDIDLIVAFPKELTSGSYSMSSYTKQRLQEKLKHNLENDGITYVPIAAKAGYLGRFLDPIYLNQLERIFIPGFPYRGPRYRIFDIEGDSMEPTLKEGYHCVSERVDQENWHSIADFYIYVIVLENDIIIKRLFKKSKEEFVVISDNDEFYPQYKMNISDIKELWRVKKKMDWNMPPPKKFEINV
ncbi:LexA family transcriptional regulator [Pinibacter soli]|uniref:LexA family transcriptional regulator n=1 Tax=Pinibacter soli TaxID=3044211 RepID=A0ABT6RBL2_9BACT|nr:LexA family transcriptional regulator [Pinibacter soli]MDI3319961.1 LexA family transcriptional regulator [Pinibacter soli]